MIKKFESFSKTDHIEGEIMDFIQEIQDEGLSVSSSKVRVDVEDENSPKRLTKRTDTFLEIYISRPWGSPNREIPGVQNPEGGYPGNLLFWFEIKDTIIHFTEWYFANSGYQPVDKSVEYRWDKSQSPLRFYTSGIEIAGGFSCEGDFKYLSDYLSFTNFRILVKL